jgi:hypothetical protein
MVIGEFLLVLASGQHDLVGVDDDDEIAPVVVRSIGRLVLPTEQSGNLRCQSAKDDVCGIDEIPRGLDVAGLR